MLLCISLIGTVRKRVSSVSNEVALPFIEMHKRTLT
jgi:hypothetical protein